MTPIDRDRSSVNGKSLDVYLFDRLAGNLIQNKQGEMEFRYSAEWLDDPEAISISQSLPLQSGSFPNSQCKGFFGGILPEGEKREIIAKNLGITPRNDYSMIEQVGGECAGAVTFLASGTPYAAREPHYRQLNTETLAACLRDLPLRPLLDDGNEVRLSLAGAQDKLPVQIIDGQMSIPLGGAISSHIIKPAINRLEGTVFNEFLCISLASAIGLPAPEVSLHKAEGIDYLLVKRYDRVPDASGRLKRLHQEDFCQALGIVSTHKYEREGGPSVQQCFELVARASSRPVVEMRQLLVGVIFNYLIGNNDAHGKNFSLVYFRPDGYGTPTRLAPFYDLLCTRIYTGLSNKLAMKIGNHYEPDKVFQRHFERMASDCGLNQKLVLRGVQSLAKSVLAKLPDVTLHDPVSNKVASFVAAQCERTLKWFRTEPA